MKLKHMVFSAAWLALLLANATAGQGQRPPNVPEPLRPWVSWVLDQHPDLACPRVGDARVCAWPGRLALDLDDRGGTFSLDVHVDRETDLPLPGSAALWPRDVRDGARPVLMRRQGDQPFVHLSPGSSRLSGRFAWSRLPESLPVPRGIALVDLSLRGAEVRHPRRETDGLLWLAASQREETEQDRLDLEVERRIEDGVPVILTTLLRLRVSGRSRAEDLGSVLPDGFTITGLSGDLPVRWTEGGSLTIQLRPGTWVITLRARSAQPVSEIALAARPADASPQANRWPAQELWAFQANPSIRAVRVSGAPGIDPQRTSLPEEWKILPVFQLAPGSRLRFEELRRGEAQPPPDAIEVQRILWLEQAGDRITVRDRLQGTLFTGGRLEAQAPATLGRVALRLDGDLRDQVITGAPESQGPGVEVRDGALDATAELSYDHGGALPAAGWNRDVQSLSAELRLPPGWTLVTAPGVDRAFGSWVDQWTLLDIFLALILSLASWKLDDKRWGMLALGFLAISWHEPHATPLWLWWLALLPLRALLRVVDPARARYVRGLRWAILVGFTLQLLIFCTDQWRTGLFPHLERSSVAMGSWRGLTNPASMLERAGEVAYESVDSSRSNREIPKPRPKKVEPLRAKQIDVNAVAQTGSGVPSWTWRTYRLTWNGPVAADQTLRLVLVSPRVEWLLSMLRIAAALLLGGCLIQPRHNPGAAAPPASEPPTKASPDQLSSPGTTATLALCLASIGWLAAPSVRAQPADEAVVESPSLSLLDQLEQRLTAAPGCHPDCVEVPRLSLRATRRGLRIEADVHVAALSAWRLPGPASAWAPTSVQVDGARADALLQTSDGFLLLRLEPGVHRVELAGPARNSFALELPLPPRTLDWQGEGWTLDGWHSDEPPPSAVRLDRQLAVGETTAPSDGNAEFEPEPWLELHRELDIGIPWLIHSELRRRGPAGTVLLTRIPLLAGESITTAGITVESGHAIVNLEPGESVRRFDSTLAETDEITLTAPQDSGWLERWELSCSPIWSCAATGLAPTAHMQNGRWHPFWQPWPGETVTFQFARLPGAPGSTTSFDRVGLQHKPGRRLLEGSLELDLRASRGGEQVLALPAGAALQSFKIDGQLHPVEVASGRVAYTLEPGKHQIVAEWRQDHRAAFFERMPAIDLGAEAVDVTVGVAVPGNRWLLWAGGPGWGPVVQFWQYLLALALAGWVLGRFTASPLTTGDWLLLAMGLTQVPLPAAALVVGWIVLLSLRHRMMARRWWSWDVQQLALIGLSVVALGVLYGAIHTGLLFQPDMQVLAPGSRPASSSDLSWYVDRSSGELPQPWVLSLPLGVWRALMLLWSLWLASRVVRWTPWFWQRLTLGPLLATPKAFKAWRETG